MQVIRMKRIKAISFPAEPHPLSPEKLYAIQHPNRYVWRREWDNLKERIRKRKHISG
jgi:hypothetical protein